MVLVGNKIDLENQRMVSYKRGEKVSHTSCHVYQREECMHNNSLKRCLERPDKAIQLKDKAHSTTCPKQSFFKEELAALGGICIIGNALTN